MILTNSETIGEMFKSSNPALCILKEYFGAWYEHEQFTFVLYYHITTIFVNSLDTKFINAGTHSN